MALLRPPRIEVLPPQEPICLLRLGLDVCEVPRLQKLRARRFFLSIAVDGEIILIASDLDDLMFKKMKVKKGELSSALISSQEHVAM